MVVKENKNEEKRFYISWVAGRDCDHRPADGYPDARFSQGKADCL